MLSSVWWSVRVKLFGKWMEILLEGLPSGNLAWLWNITILKRDGIYVSSNSMGHGFHNLPVRKLLVNFFLFFAHKNLQGTSRTGTKRKQRKQRKPQNLLALTVWMRAFQTPGTQWLLMHSSAHMPEKQANAVHQQYVWRGQRLLSCWKFSLDLLQENGRLFSMFDFEYTWTLNMFCWHPKCCR